MPTASSSCPQFLTPKGRDSGTEARKHAEMMARNLKMDTRGNELPSPHETWTWAPPSPHSPVCPPLAAPAAVASSPSCNSPDTTSGHLQWRFPPPRRFALGHPQGQLLASFKSLLKCLLHYGVCLLGTAFPPSPAPFIGLYFSLQ